MRRSARLLNLVAAFTAVLTPSLAQAQSTGLEDLVDARAGQAEAELGRRGYRNTGGQQGDDRSYSNWWNADRRQCVTIATMDGRYSSITPTPAPDCGQAVRERPRPPVHQPSASAGAIHTEDLSRFCKGEASARFDRRPSEITTNAPIRQRNGSIVQGWFETDGRTTFFNCRFDADGRFLSVL